jgi:hypothetical protein
MNRTSCIKVDSSKGNRLLYKGNETAISLGKQRNSGSCPNESSVARWRSVPEWCCCGSYLLIKPCKRKGASEIGFKVFQGFRTNLD